MAISPSSFTKQPSERFVLSVDFSKRLQSTEVIQSKVVGATYGDDDASTDVLDGSEINAEATGISVGIKGGVTGRDYKITVTVTTNLLTPDNNAYIHEGDIVMSVIEE